MGEDFATIGRNVKAKSGAYQDLPDEVVGQAYLKKTNPLQYELYKNQIELQKTQGVSDIQAQKELEVSRLKREEEYKFKQENPEIEPLKQEDIEKKEAGVLAKQSALSVVDDILSRDFGAITGAKNPLKYITKEAQYTKALVDQLKAKLSLDARSLIKGTGQISDIEVKMLADSVNALGADQKGRYQLRNEDFKRELLNIKNILEGKGGERATVENKPSYLEELVKNVPKEAGEIAGGIAGLTGQVAKVSPPVQVYNMLKGNQQQNVQNIQELGSTVAGIPGAVVQDVKSAVKDPLGYIKENPVSTALILAPFLKGLKPLSKAKVVTAVESTAVKELAPEISTIEKLAKGSKTVSKITSPIKTILLKQKEKAFKLYEDVPVDLKVIDNAAREFIKRYPTKGKIYEEYKTAIKSSNTIKKLDKSLGEWGDAFKTNQEIKPGIKNDFLGTIWKAGRKEIEAKAPQLSAVKTLMGEDIKFGQAASKALWKAVLAKLLLGK